MRVELINARKLYVADHVKRNRLVFFHDVIMRNLFIQTLCDINQEGARRLNLLKTVFNLFFDFSDCRLAFD